MSEHAPKRRGPMGGHGPMGGMHMAGEKAKDFKGSFKKLLKYLGKYRVAIVIVMIFAIASAAFMVLGPKILGKAITEMMNGLIAKVTGVEGGGINFGRIGEILLFMLGLYVLSAAFSFIQGFIMTGVSQKVAYNMRRELSEKIGRLPMKYFDSRTHGEVLSRVTNDVDTLSQSLNQSLTQIITAVTTIIGVLIMMLTISWLMTLITFIILPISLGLIGLIMKKSQKYFQAQQEYLGHINGQVEEVYGVTRQQFHDYLEAEDVGLAVVKFKNGAVGTIEGTTNVYPKNLEETLYLFGEQGTVKIGGTSTNNIDVWQFADAEAGDTDKQGLQEATSNVYGNGHTSLFADMMEAIEQNRKPYVDAVAGRNALEMVLAIYKSQKAGAPVKLPLQDFASTDMAGEFISGKA